MAQGFGTTVQADAGGRVWIGALALLALASSASAFSPGCMPSVLSSSAAARTYSLSPASPSLIATSLRVRAAPLAVMLAKKKVEYPSSDIDLQ